MRVLLWSDYYWPAVGGTEIFAHNLIRGMRGRGVEFEVVANTAEEGGNAPANDGDAAVHRLPLRRSLEGRVPAEVVAVRRRLGEIFTRFRPHLIHEISLGPGDVFLLPARRAAPTPSLVTLQQHLPSALLAVGTPVGRALRSAAAIATCSAATRDELLADIPELASHCVVVSNALPDAEAQPVVDPPRVPRLLCLGRLVADKGFDLAVRAFADVCAAFPGARLVIAGDGPCRAALAELAQRLGVAGAVGFEGWVDPSARLALIDSVAGVVVPSRREPFGLVALEAALRARPAVVSAVGGLTEVVDDGETGLVVESGDVPALAAALRRLLEDPETAARLGRAARARARQRFSWRAHLDAYGDLYARLRGVEG